jgi:hypothetical protein
LRSQVGDTLKTDAKQNEQGADTRVRIAHDRYSFKFFTTSSISVSRL